MEYAGPNTLASFWRRLAARLAQKADAGHSHTLAELGAAAATHGHVLGDIAELTEALAGKADKTAGVYPVVGTHTQATAQWTGALDLPALYDGLTIALFLPYTGVSGTGSTLELTLSDGSTTGPVPVYYNASTAVTTHYGAGSTVLLTFWSAGSISVAGTPTTESRWTRADYNANTVAQCYCSTSAGTRAKTGSCSGFVLREDAYLMVTLTASNSYNGSITLNVNSTGAKAIYINGAASSASNRTLPAGVYIVRYKSNRYYFRTDEKIEGIPTDAELSALEARVAALENA